MLTQLFMTFLVFSSVHNNFAPQSCIEQCSMKLNPFEKCLVPLPVVTSAHEEVNNRMTIIDFTYSPLTGLLGAKDTCLAIAL